tara:strand:+ start:256 stop:708 length:453 start_codon:yes stop_codon:yes gene_type:complete
MVRSGNRQQAEFWGFVTVEQSSIIYECLVEQNRTGYTDIAQALGGVSRMLPKRQFGDRGLPVGGQGKLTHDTIGRLLEVTNYDPRLDFLLEPSKNPVTVRKSVPRERSKPRQMILEGYLDAVRHAHGSLPAARRRDLLSELDRLVDRYTS